MLNIKTEKGNTSNVVFPIYFEKKNICVHCGAKNQLVFIDSFGRETKKEIYPFTHIKCKACGTKYDILWQMDEETKKMYPSAVDPSMKKDFLNDK